MQNYKYEITGTLITKIIPSRAENPKMQNSTNYCLFWLILKN